MLTTERQGEIALCFLKHKLWKEGVKVGELTHRQINATAKELGIAPEEAKEFAKILVSEVVDRAFKQ